MSWTNRLYMSPTRYRHWMQLRETPAEFTFSKGADLVQLLGVRLNTLEIGDLQSKGCISSTMQGSTFKNGVPRKVYTINRAATPWCSLGGVIHKFNIDDYLDILIDIAKHALPATFSASAFAQVCDSEARVIAHILTILVSRGLMTTHMVSTRGKRLYALSDAAKEEIA